MAAQETLPGAGSASVEVHAMSDGSASLDAGSSADYVESDAPVPEEAGPDGWLKLLGAADEAARAGLLVEWKQACGARARPRRAKAAGPRGAVILKALR